VRFIEKFIQSEVTFVPTEVTSIVLGMVLQMHLQARQFLLGSVFLGDQWMQFLHYASVRVRAGWVIPPHFSVGRNKAKRIVSGLRNKAKRLVSDPIGGTAIWHFSNMNQTQKPSDEDRGSLACSLADKIR
jgi:hypothetical protein